MNEQTTPAVDGTKSGLAKTMLLYTFLRLVMFVALTAIIYYAVNAVVDFPLILAALFALIISLPLSMIVLTDMRKKLNAQIAAFEENRRAYRSEMESRLRGDDAV